VRTPNSTTSIEHGVQVTVEGQLSQAEVDRARERVAGLAKYTRGPLENARLTLRVGGASRAARTFFIADASVTVDGRLLAAHAAGPTAGAAAEAVSDRLRRQMRRIVGVEVARRNEPAVIAEAASDLGFNPGNRPAAARLKPPEEREIVTVRTVPSEPESTLGAVAELLDRDYEFNLFRHVRTAEDVVVYRRGEQDIGLLHPPGSPLSDENEIVVPRPSRYPEPITLAAARSGLDVLNDRFLYFTDAEDRRGKVLYLRHDGDYGLVQTD
jgi:ribosome-associated translation inhibitor RaiA